MVGISPFFASEMLLNEGIEVFEVDLDILGRHSDWVTNILGFASSSFERS